jgi:hypothetical protein
MKERTKVTEICFSNAAKRSPSDAASFSILSLSVTNLGVVVCIVNAPSSSVARGSAGGSAGGDVFGRGGDGDSDEMHVELHGSRPRWPLVALCDLERRSY